ncbi:MAG: DMT family transporter [Calditrichota bacterium]
MIYPGEFAALGAAWCWSFTSMFFAAAGRRLGAFKVNVIRLTMALPLLAVTSLVWLDSSIPAWYQGGRIIWLGLSGIVGLVIGDFAFFRSLVLLGPRKSTLVFSTSPIIAALLSWPLLGEKLSLTAWLGIILTVMGVVWVVVERSTGGNKAVKSPRPWGIFLALIAAACQALGLILSKAGMAGVVNPLAATLFRLLTATVVVWIYVLVRGQSPAVYRAAQQTPVTWWILGGAVTGPYIGVWLSIVAVKYAETGIAATLMGTVPILVLPLVWIVYHERISPRALIGTIAAVGGIILLFQR